MRKTPNGHPFVIERRMVADVTPDERQAIYEAAWEKGGLQFRATFHDLLLDKAANDTAAEFIKNKIRTIVKDKATAEKLADIDHPYAAKRPPIDTDYFETFNRDNVSLVDVRADPIERITPGRHPHAQRQGAIPLDIIVFATGFDAMTGPLLRMNIRGRDGLALARRVESGPAQLPRPAGRGLPEPLHHHRAGQPVGAVQHAGRHRAARGMDHRLHRPDACQGPRSASRPRTQAMDEWVQRGEPRRQRYAAAAGPPLLVLSAPTCRQAARVHALRRRHGALRDICAGVAARGYEGFALS